ncbi:MAG: DNA-binding protein YbiB [Telluria sp.]
MDQGHPEQFAAARFIKEIGRGRKGARAMARPDAQALFQAILDGRVSDLELGAIVLALRIKGEDVEELAGFFAAANASFPQLHAPGGEFAPVLIPSYNGSRKLPNLTPLLAMLLARQGVPVLVHGVTEDPGRVTTAEILAAMQLPAARDLADVQSAWALGHPAFLPIRTLAPRLARLLALREVLGVRNSAHTLVKVLQPFDGPALRLVSYTHPEYLESLGAFFALPEQAALGDAFLMRGTEGETVANATRGQQVDWFHGGERSVLIERDPPADERPELPAADAQATADWIRAALRGQVEVPQPIREQAEHIVMAAAKLRGH